MAEPTGDLFLLYLIDMAIFEANAKARVGRDNPVADGASWASVQQTPTVIGFPRA